MKVIVASDSHGNSDILEKIIISEPDADVYIHCGDLEIDSRIPKRLNYVCVRGNNDLDYGIDEFIVKNLNGIETLIIHGHQAGYVKRDEKLAELAKKNNCSLVLFGHWHVPYDKLVDNVRIISPGALTMPRSDFKGYAKLTILNDNVEEIVVEYEKI